MTVQADDALKEYPGNGVAVLFDGPRLFDPDTLTVTLVDDATGAVTSPSYTLTNVGVNGPSLVQMDAAPALGYTLQLRRTLAYAQTSNFTNQQTLLRQVVENTFDVIVMLIQQLADGVRRSFKLGDNVIGVDATLPPPEPLATWRWNGAANAVEYYYPDAFAGPGGADQVGFLQSGAGAIARTLQSKDRDFVSLLDYIPQSEHAAIRAGTSTYDAAGDINRALEDHRSLVMPAGKYMLGSTLLLRDRTTLSGEGWAVPYSGAAVQAPSGSVFKLLPGADCDVFRQFDTSYRQSFHLRGFAIDGDGANQSDNMGPDGTYGMYQFNRNAFFFEALYNTVLEDIFWFNMRGAGLALHGDAVEKITNLFVKHCHGYNARTYNIYTEGAVTDVRVDGGDYGFGRVANARLGSSFTVNGATFWTSQCQDITDPNTHINGTGAVAANGAGVVLAGSNTRINGGRSEGNAGHGIRIAGDNNTVNDAVLYANSFTAGTSGVYSGVRVDSGSDNNTLQSIEVRQADSSIIPLNMAIDLDAGSTGTRIFGCGNIKRIDANAAERVGRVVAGVKSGDRSDFTWSNTILDVHQTTLNAIGGAFTAVSFQAENVDNRNAWGGTTFTAPEFGNYRVSTGVGFSAADGGNVQVSIYINGAEHKRLQSQRSGGAGSVQLGGSMVLGLNQGDTVEIRAFASPGCNTVVGSTITWLKINQVMS